MVSTAVVVPSSMVIASLIPATESPASSMVTVPQLRGTDPRARCPRTARARRRVVEVWVPHSSMNTSRPGSTPRMAATHAVRAS